VDSDRLQSIAARDQLWASLGPLGPEIDKIAQGEFDGSARERQVLQILARIVVAELQYRADNPEDGDNAR
jgi:hypothetical protein